MTQYLLCEKGKFLSCILLCTDFTNEFFAAVVAIRESRVKELSAYHIQDTSSYKDTL